MSDTRARTGERISDFGEWLGDWLSRIAETLRGWVSSLRETIGDATDRIQAKMSQD